MSATGLLLFLLGIWIIINSPKLADVIKGNLAISLTKPKSTTGTVQPPGSPKPL